MSITRSITRPITNRLSRALTAPGIGGGAFNPTSEFAGGRKGVLYDYTDKTKLTGVVNATDLIDSALDQSGNGYHASQAGAIRPAWNNGRAEFSSGDSLKATGVDLSGTDVVTIVAAVYKSTDVTLRVISEHGSNGGTEPGVMMYANPFDGGAGFAINSRGTTLAACHNAPNSPAPTSAVVTGIYRISTDTCVLRVNGEIVAASIADQGAGNYQNADLFISAGLDGTGQNAGTNQYRYMLIDKELTEDSLNNVEQWAADSIGATIGPAKFAMLAIGDSLTYAQNGSVTANQAYVKQLDTRLSRVTYSVNAGSSGNTTSNMISRKWQMIRYSTPNLCLIYGGTNDPATSDTVKASPAPTSTAVALNIYAAGYDPGAWITVAGESAQILSRVGNLITLTAPLAAGAPAAGAAVAHDTQKNLTEMANYVKNAGCKRVMIVGMHYFNFNTGADTTTVELARNATLRTKQRAAATASGAVYVDLYAWMSALITAGTYTQGDNGWHLSTNDQHLNLAGQTIIADAIEAAIVAQGWT